MTAEMDGEEIPITTREFQILYKMLSYPKKTFSRAQLMDKFWGVDTETGLRAVAVGAAGTACTPGATFAVTAGPPVLWLCILLAVPGFLGWALPYFLYQRIRRRKAQKLQPLIEAKYDEIYEICQKVTRFYRKINIF